MIRSTTKRDWKRDRVPYRPATFGHLTIGQLFHILNVIQLRPYAEIHSFVFGRDYYQVKVYKDEEPDTDESENVHSETDGGNSGG